MAGEINNFTGISDPYEEPTNPDIMIETNQVTAEESTARIIAWLEQQGYIDNLDHRVQTTHEIF